MGDRLTDLEEQLRERSVVTQQSTISPQANQNTTARVLTTPEATPEAARQFAPQVMQQRTMYDNDFLQEPHSGDSPFATWIKQDFLVKLGAFLLLLALGWFVSLAFANNWIGPVGRITLGLCTGALIMLVGIWRIATHPSQGSIFTVLGSTTMILTVFAARFIYEFFTPASALMFMFVVVGFVAFVSVRYRREPLAIASLLLGAAAPMLTNTPVPDVTALSLYLMALVIGTLWVVYRLQSAVLTPLALGVVFLYGLPYIDASNYSDQLLALMFSFVFTMIFLSTNIMSILSLNTKPAEQIHYLTAMGTGLYLLLWIMGAAPAVWQTPLYLVWMLVFATTSFLVYIKTSNRVPFYIYGSVSLALLAAATADLFDGAILTIVYAIELGALVVLANNVVLNSLVARRLTLLYVGLILFSFQHLEALSGYGDFTALDLSALIVVTASLAIAGYSLVRTRPDIATDDSIQPGWALVSTAGLYVGAIIWLTLHQSLPAGLATTMSLVIYTIIGLVVYIQGRANNLASLMLAGKIIIGGVVIRLLLVDVWQLETAERIVVFFIIGLLLLSTAFLKQKPQV